jgi:hypothetical protein
MKISVDTLSLSKSISDLKFDRKRSILTLLPRLSPEFFDISSFCAYSTVSDILKESLPIFIIAILYLAKQCSISLYIFGMFLFNAKIMDFVVTTASKACFLDLSN